MSLLSVIRGRRGEPRYGRDSYRQVEKLIRAEKHLLIVSPYIDDYYAEFLARNSRGKTMHVISSSIQRSASKILLGRRFPALVPLAMLLASVDVVVAGLSTAIVLAVFAATIAANVAYVATLFHRPHIYLKVPKEFVHAKMYVGYWHAIEGSANLTYAGMHKNIERISVISRRDDVAELRDAFWKLWRQLR